MLPDSLTSVLLESDHPASLACAWSFSEPVCSSPQGLRWASWISTHQLTLYQVMRTDSRFPHHCRQGESCKESCPSRSPFLQMSQFRDHRTDHVNTWQQPTSASPPPRGGCKNPQQQAGHNRSYPSGNLGQKWPSAPNPALGTSSITLLLIKLQFGAV